MSLRRVFDVVKSGVIKAYRTEFGGERNVGAGKFYSLREKSLYSSFNQTTTEFDLSKIKVLHVDPEPYFGGPAQKLAHEWWPGRNWRAEVDYQGDITKLMDREVAKKARELGYDVIKYGDIELQDVRENK